MKVEVPQNMNYCVTVVETKIFSTIENSDRIKYANLLGYNVIVNVDMVEGTKGLFFPIESKISLKFLSEHNLLRDWAQNIANNPDVKGFFETNGRVRAVRLRGNKSEGFFIPFTSLTENYKKLVDLPVGTEFDVVDGETICEKYVVNKHIQGSQKPKQGKSKHFERLVENQFHFHIDTIDAKKAFGSIKPNEVVSLTNKLHGTSVIFANILTKRPYKLYEKILSLFGIKINNTEYGNVYSSRKVVKNKYINADQPKGFYDVDIWGLHNEEIKDIIPKGISIYGEIVGYLPKSSKAVQSGYTYGQEVGTSKLYVYRITNTNQDGLVTEYSWLQIKEFCNKYGLTHVPEFYYGTLHQLYPDIPIDDDWNRNTLNRLMNDFNLEKPCELNDNKVPAEGLVIRPERLYDCIPQKLKSFKFLEHETKLLDKGESDIESEQ